MTIETRFNIKDRVRHIAEPPDDRGGVVIGFMLKDTNHSYLVAWSAKSSEWHHDFELELVAPMNPAGFR